MCLVVQSVEKKWNGEVFNRLQVVQTRQGQSGKWFKALAVPQGVCENLGSMHSSCWRTSRRMAIAQSTVL